MELFGGCNYSCSMCPQGSEKGREPEFKKALSWSNFLKIVDEAEKHGVESISLHGGGEPTLNKYFIPAIKYIKKRGIQCTSLSNGYNLDDYLIDQIIESEIDIFKISVVGYDEQTYEKMMSKDAFKYVRENVKNLVRQTKGTNTRVQSQHLILDPEKKDYEVEQLRHRYRRRDMVDAQLEWYIRR